MKSASTLTGQQAEPAQAPKPEDDTVAPTPGPGAERGNRTWTWVRWGAIAALVVVAAILPFVNRYLPGVFSGAINSPGVMNLLAVMLVFAAFAISYDLLFGYTGLLSFGHSLYFALGVYGSAVIFGSFQLGLIPSIGVILLLGLRDLSAGERYRLRDGHPGLRPGRIDLRGA